MEVVSKVVSIWIWVYTSLKEMYKVERTSHATKICISSSYRAGSLRRSSFRFFYFHRVSRHAHSSFYKGSHTDRDTSRFPAFAQRQRLDAIPLRCAWTGSEPREPAF